MRNLLHPEVALLKEAEDQALRGLLLSVDGDRQRQPFRFLAFCSAFLGYIDFALI